MEVLLLQDIAGVGSKDDILVVGDGYALNHLLPQSKALVATPTVRRRYADKIRARAEARERERMAAASGVAQAAGKTLTLKRKATKTGKLYAAITEKHIVEALKADHSIEVEETSVSIPEPIKALGEFTITLTMNDLTESMGVTVEEEK